MTDRCIYESCGHALASPHDCKTDELLCAYHANGEKILDAFYALRVALLSSERHRFNETLYSLDLEEDTVRSLYEMPEGW